MRTALYIRTSTTEQDPESQARQLRAHAAQHGLEITREYSDQESGASQARAGLQRMLTDAAARRFDVLLFFALDRLTRRGVRHALELLETLQRCQVQIICLQQPALNTAGPLGDMIRAVYAALAEMERDLIRARTSAGMDRARAQGKHIGRPRSIVSVDRIAMLRAQGKSESAIARELRTSRATIRRRLAPPSSGLYKPTGGIHALDSPTLEADHMPA